MDQIEIWRSATGIEPADFHIRASVDAIPDWQWVDLLVVPGHTYWYKTRLWQEASDSYSAFSALVPATAPPLERIHPMVPPLTGQETLFGIGLQANYNVNGDADAVLPQKLLDRTKGGPTTDLQALDRKSLINIDTPKEAIAGIANTDGQVTVHMSPEGLSRANCMAFGNPVTTRGGGTAPSGGGTAPAVSVATPSDVGGDIPSETQVFFKTTYNRTYDGETKASNEFSATTDDNTETNSISVASPAAQTGASSWNLYAAETTGDEVLVASDLPIGTPYVFDSLDLIDDGREIPTPLVATPSNVGGVIPEDTAVFFRIAYKVPVWDYTTASAVFTATTAHGAATNKFSIASPPAQTGATGWALYAAVESGEEVLVADDLDIGDPYLFTDLDDIITGARAWPHSFWVHTWKNTIPNVHAGTLVESKPPLYAVYPNAKVGILNHTVDKEQTEVLMVDYTFVALNEFFMGSLEEIGLDTVGVDPLECWGPVDVEFWINGAVTDAARSLTWTVNKNLKAQQVLNRKRGPVGHFARASSISGNAQLYFNSKEQVDVYFGQLDEAAVPYGATKVIRTIPLEERIIGNFNADGYRNRMFIKFPRVSYKKTTQTVEGPDEVMQRIEFTGYHSVADGTSFIIQLWNSEAHADLIADSTVIEGVPANEVQ